MGNGNLTLTESQLAECLPTRGSKRIRAYCPFHGSDNQRSLRIDREAGRFKCFACGAWGYMDWAREKFKKTWAKVQAGIERARNKPPTPRRRPVEREVVRPVRSDLDRLAAEYACALLGSVAEEYLRKRRIPLDLARSLGVGYAASDRWPNRHSRWPHGRIVLPHTDPDGTIVSLYGRAVEPGEPAPKKKRHDHLAGNKGYFNAPALRHDGPVWICEGAFDALALLAAGVPAACAIFGVDGWRWEWARDVVHLVFAFDLDDGGAKWVRIAREARLRGIAVSVLEESAYGGTGDVAEAWQAGVLVLPEDLDRPAPPARPARFDARAPTRKPVAPPAGDPLPPEPPRPVFRLLLELGNHGAWLDVEDGELAIRFYPGIEVTPEPPAALDEIEKRHDEVVAFLRRTEDDLSDAELDALGYRRREPGARILLDPDHEEPGWVPRPDWGLD